MTNQQLGFVRYKSQLCISEIKQLWLLRQKSELLNWKLTIRIFALEIRVVYFRDCTARIFAVKIRVV